MAVSYTKIGKNIAKERNLAGLTQEELAEHLGISTSHFSNIERAQRKASISTLVEVCKVLNISLERLLQGAVDNVAFRDSDMLIGDDARIKQQIIEIVEGCNAKTRKHILDMCLMMSDLENP